MTSRERAIVRNKFGGKCGYCGCDLPEKGWHVDHIEPVYRKTKMIDPHYKHEDTGEVLPYLTREVEDRGKWRRIERKVVPDGFHKPENDHIGNYMPACASCNINKHEMNIEEFRNSIAYFIQSLNKNSTQYKFAKKYNLIVETKKTVVFYFETLNSKQDPPNHCEIYNA